MTRQNQATKVYLSADALFDLRLGTLVTISTDFALELTKDGKYFHRSSDIFSTPEFGELDKEIYDKVFESRKSMVLKNSLVTRILPFVVNLLVELLKQNDLLHVKKSIELDINTYPFTLSDEEAKELLTLIVGKMGKVVSINLIHLSDQELTPDYVVDNYVAMVMYKYHDWFNLYNEEVKTRKLSGVGFYLPRVNFISEFTEEQKEKLRKNKADIFEIFAKAMRYFAMIQFAPVYLYSADLPNNTNMIKK